MIVQLTWRELIDAARVGVMRQIGALQKNLQAAHGAELDEERLEGASWGKHVQGAITECAAAKALGIHWHGDSEGPSDLDAGNAQIRSTTWPKGCLLVHNEDREDQAFVLVIDRCPRFELVGWMMGADAKNPLWWRDKGKNGRPAFFVPQDALNPMASLPLEVIQ